MLKMVFWKKNKGNNNGSDSDSQGQEVKTLEDLEHLITSESKNLALDDKVKTKSDKNSKKLPNQIDMVMSYEDIDSSAKLLWIAINDAGTVSNIAQGYDTFSKKFEGNPVMRTDPTGFIYPVDAIFNFHTSDSSYVVDFNSRSISGFTVKITTDKENMSFVQDLFKSANKDLISISKTYEEKSSLAKLYGYLKENSSSLEFKPTNSCGKPQMEFDEEFGLIPVDASLHTQIDGKNYIFDVEYDHYRKVKVKAQCSKEDLDSMMEILDLFSKKKVLEGESGVKTLESSVDVKNYSWDSVGGLSSVKSELEEYIEWPLENPDLFHLMDTKMPKGILLIGPPGNGKTTIAKILASETDSSFYSITPADINSKWVGESEQNVQKLFNKARNDVNNGKSAIIFIDEIDGLYTNREEMDKYTRKTFGQFCSEMEGISDLDGVVIIGATNKYEDLDEALV
ncbi:MAG: AAA family ATPase, partial [bacterium]